MDVKPKAGKRRVTFKDIARELRVAVSTVSNAYNRPKQLSPALREKVFETAKALGYSGPNPAARGLRRGETGVVGLVYPDRLSYAFTDPAEALLIQDVAREAEEHGFSLLLIGAYSLAKEGSPVTEANVDGFIVHAFSDDDPLCAAVLARGQPTVLVNDAGVAGLPTVAVDDEGGAEAAAAHLLGLGHRRLGVVALELDRHAKGELIGREHQNSARYRPTRARLDGYRQAVAAAGLEWERDILVYESFENSLAEGFRAAEALLAQSPRPTGILAMSDQLALGVLRYARDTGVRVPEELSVVGYDDALPFQGTPALTTVHQPHVEKGQHAARSLIALLRTKRPGPSHSAPSLPCEKQLPDSRLAVGTRSSSKGVGARPGYNWVRTVKSGWLRRPFQVRTLGADTKHLPANPNGDRPFLPIPSITGERYFFYSLRSDRAN